MNGHGGRTPTCPDCDNYMQRIPSRGIERWRCPSTRQGDPEPEPGADWPCGRPDSRPRMGSL